MHHIVNLSTKDFKMAFSFATGAHWPAMGRPHTTQSTRKSLWVL